MTDTPIDDFLDLDGFIAEYRASVAALDLPLPDGVTLPDTPPYSEEQAEGLFEPGAGDVAALFAWRVIVERAAVDAHEAGDEDEARRWALAAGRFVATETYARWNDHTAEPSYFDAVIVPALRGDFTALAANIESYDAPAAV